MAKPKRKSNKRNTLNNHSSKSVHSGQRKVRRQASSTVHPQLLKIWYWLYIAYKVGSFVEFLLNYWPIDF